MRLHCNIRKQNDTNKSDIYNKLIEKLEKQEEEIIKLKKQNDEIQKKLNLNDKQINIGNNNIITNNTTNNITIVAYGREDLNKIDESDILKALVRGTNSVPIITELIHYNDQYPEFQNIYIPNINQKYCMIYNGKEWLLKDNNDIIDSLYSNKYSILEDKFDEFYNKLTLSQQKSFKRFIEVNDKADNDDEECIKILVGIKKELKLLLYNKRNMIKKIQQQNNI